jgi:hypothetical protein
MTSKKKISFKARLTCPGRKQEIINHIKLLLPSMLRLNVPILLGNGIIPRWLTWNELIEGCNASKKIEELEQELQSA